MVPVEALNPHSSSIILNTPAARATLEVPSTVPVREPRRTSTKLAALVVSVIRPVVPFSTEKNPLPVMPVSVFGRHTKPAANFVVSTGASEHGGPNVYRAKIWPVPPQLIRRMPPTPPRPLLVTIENVPPPTVLIVDVNMPYDVSCAVL